MSYAKVHALYRIQVLRWQRTRDYFVADLHSTKLNSYRKEGDKVFTADDILASRYPKLKQKEYAPHDPDRGATGDWKALRENLRGHKRPHGKRRPKPYYA